MGFAYGTPVGGPSGDIAIERLQHGDQVMTASLRGGAAPSWSVSAVEYSDGTGPHGRTTAVFIGFDDGGEHGGRHGGEHLVCEPDQLFLSGEGLLVQARRLFQGRYLLRPGGGERLIAFVGAGEFEGGIHAIATGLHYSGSPDGHLIAAGGVIAGDFLLQLQHRDGTD